MGSKPVECTYSWCLNRFDTIKEMKQHKVNEPDHFYCKRCDVDCKDWDDLTNHKVESMAPFIEGKRSDREEGALKHIVCEFCGTDFKSWGGRRRHRIQNHQADQDVKCPGCDTKFARASHFIRHLEFGECDKISPFFFQGSIQQKRIVGQLMEDPEEFVRKMDQNNARAASSITRGLIEDKSSKLSKITSPRQDPGGSEVVDDEEGGVPLLIDIDSSPTRHAAEAWPRLPSHVTSGLTNSMATMSIGTAASEDGGAKTYQEDFPSLGASCTQDNGSAKSVVSSQVSPGAGSWAVAGASQTLFPDSKKEPPSLEMIRLLEERDREASKLTNESNALHSHFMNPDSPDYKVERFANKQHGGYYCPFPRCDMTFHAANDVGEHIAEDHTRQSFVCPYCHKYFKFATSLIAHAESAQKCRVRETSTFNKLLDEVSGGFLMSHGVRAPRLFRTEHQIVKHGHPTEGIMDRKFYSTVEKH